jgi:hypothetical protein
MKYDPSRSPDPAEWLALDESERLDLIVQYHDDADVELPNRDLHAAIHSVVENQVAMGDETTARATLDRLTADGLDRHEAIHAIGSVLAKHLYNLFRSEGAGPDPHASYLQELESLTAEDWRSST